MIWNEKNVPWHNTASNQKLYTISIHIYTQLLNRSKKAKKRNTTKHFACFFSWKNGRKSHGLKWKDWDIDMKKVTNPENVFFLFSCLLFTSLIWLREKTKWRWEKVKETVFCCSIHFSFICLLKMYFVDYVIIHSFLFRPKVRWS